MEVDCRKHAEILLLFCISLLFTSNIATGAMTYGVGTRGSCGIYEVDFGPGSANLLFATPDIGWYGATDGDPRNPDTFYATPYGHSLYRIDVVNKTATAVGSYGDIAITGLAYDEMHDVLYATDYKNLYMIDITPGSPTEGTPTLIGAFSAYGDAWAFDYDASIDELVAMTQACCGTKTYYIDRTTGVAKYVGFDCTKRITDIWYDADSQKMFGVGNNPVTGTGRLYEINSSNGQIIKTDCIRHDLLGLGKPTPVPEPATVVLLSVGSLAFLRKKRRAV